MIQRYELSEVTLYMQQLVSSVTFHIFLALCKIEFQLFISLLLIFARLPFILRRGITHQLKITDESLISEDRYALAIENVL